MHQDQVIQHLAELLGQRLKVLDLQLALAESCTGGGIAHAVTDIAGSSGWFDRGFVTYSNASKSELLGVNPHTLVHHGAVSRETALEMADGALNRSHADVVIAVTGIAGPGGGSPEKPVGTVFIAWQRRGEDGHCVRRQFDGDRCAVRNQVIHFSLRHALSLVETENGA